MGNQGKKGEIREKWEIMEKSGNQMQEKIFEIGEDGIPLNKGNNIHRNVKLILNQ